MAPSQTRTVRRPRVHTERDPLRTRLPRRGILAAGAPVSPPAEWFTDPKLAEPTPLVVTADGQVYGHIAAWGTHHIGLPGRVVPPKSRSGYQYFKTGEVVCADGSKAHVGQLTLAGGHAPLSAGASAAVSHYDSTESAVADLNVGEDSHGIWVAGALRPGVDDNKIRSIRASAPSGDWRPINSGLELVGILQVNVPGFPIARTRLTASGAVTALVAAGAQDMFRRRYGLGTDPALVQRVEDLAEQVQTLTAALKAADDERDRERMRQAVASA